MVVLELLRVAVSLLAILLMGEAQAARALARQPEHLAACPALLELPVPHLLLAGCLGKAAVVAAVALLARAVLAALEVAALVVAAVVQHAAHTLLALVG